MSIWTTQIVPGILFFVWWGTKLSVDLGGMGSEYDQDALYEIPK